MFDPITIGVGLLVWFGFKKQSNTQFGVLTPEREEVYKNAMEHLKDAPRLAELAKEFEKNGLKAQAYWMKKRAEWRGRTEAVKRQHDEIFDKAMKSENIQAILEVASVFEAMTGTMKAGSLRERAKSLQALKDIPKNTPPEEKSTNGLSADTAKAE